ncbi:hypothetical protein QAD02_022510 [Eretmocerus hayati]|uniref:Uncharacterized protein n=1 Tax=Eretmocerus hayati TaxID=131215 RepID=A0ACC2PUU4_9HYME|nr:hypothetical protein QAD02_022510 [Eretmocerus hayati]
MLALFLFISVTLVLFHLFVFCGRKGRLVNKVPGPPTLPVLGNLWSLNVSTVKLFDLLREWADEYYPSFRIWVGTEAAIFIRHPDDVEILLTNSKEINKGLGYKYFYPWLKEGLLTSGAQKWHQRRKILTPAFHFNILKKYMEITNENTRKLVELTKATGERTKLSLMPYCSKYTLNIICESAMGVSLDDDQDKDMCAKYKNSIYKMGNILVYRVLKPFIFDWMVPFVPYLRKHQGEALRDSSNFIEKIIEDRRSYHRENVSDSLKEVSLEDKIMDMSSDDTISGKKKRLAMLDLLLLSEKDGLIDEDGIKEEVSTFVFEGHDTTAMAMSFTLMLLAENEDAQAKAREEVERVLNNAGPTLEISDLQQMNYLERCIKESIRLFPSVPAVSRKLSDDLQFRNFKAPRGSNVTVEIYDVHRDPKFWPEPTKFDPDRFLPDRIQSRHPFSYIPFSAGPRNCIGQKFAMMELKSLIARILYNFYLKPIDFTRDVEFMVDVVIRPSHPIYTQFVKIDRE